MTTNLKTTSSRTPRASCRVACVVAAVLVTLGGLRLLVAAEPTRQVPTADVVVTVATVRPVTPAKVGVYGTTSADFAATVEHTARKIECIPDACGFPRVRTLDDGTRGWGALAARVTSAVPPTFLVERPVGLSVSPEEWVLGSTCGLACPQQLHTPGALTARF